MFPGTIIPLNHYFGWRIVRIQANVSHQHIARVHWRSLRGKDLDDLAFLWRLKFILHLHGLDHDYTCAVFHLDTGLSDHANNFSRHGSHDLLRAILRARASTASAPRARISHLN